MLVAAGNRSRPTPVDVMIAALAVSVDLALFTTLSDGTGQVGWVERGTPSAVIICAGLLAIPVLAYRRQAPAIVCLALAGHSVAVTAALGSRPLISLSVALYAAAVLCDRARAQTCLAAVLVAHGIAVAYEASFEDATAFSVLAVGFVYMLVDVSIWSTGRWGASASARARAKELKESRARLAAAAVDAERRHIARELHDIVAHAVTGMVLQSAGAQRVATTQPERATEAMQAVEQLGVQAIAELRRLLTVMRPESRETNADAGSDEHLSVESPKGLANLAEIIEPLENDGFRIATTRHGVEGSLDPSVDLAVFRIVQEGLTNAAKHGAIPSTARVSLKWTPYELVVEIVNQVDSEGRPANDALNNGFGLVGLQERVSLIGGTLTAGPRNEGEFALVAALPVRAGAFNLEARNSVHPMKMDV